MLVLTRRVNEEIQISDNITIQIVEVKGGRVRIGISAPRDVGIRRGEVSPGGTGVYMPTQRPSE